MKTASFVTNVLVLIGLILIYYFQNEKIKTSNTPIDSQSEVLNSVKTYFDIFKMAW